jgi:hypothetical protein
MLQPHAITTCYNQMVQPPATTTCYNHMVQPPATTTCYNQMVQPPATTTWYNHLLQPHAITTCYNQMVQPHAPTTCYNHKLQAQAAAWMGGTFGLTQGTFGLIQGTFGLNRRTIGLIQGTFGLIEQEGAPVMAKRLGKLVPKLRSPNGCSTRAVSQRISSLINTPVHRMNRYNREHIPRTPSTQRIPPVHWRLPRSYWQCMIWALSEHSVNIE